MPQKRLLNLDKKIEGLEILKTREAIKNQEKESKKEKTKDASHKLAANTENPELLSFESGLRFRDPRPKKEFVPKPENAEKKSEEQTEKPEEEQKPATENRGGYGGRRGNYSRRGGDYKRGGSGKPKQFQANLDDESLFPSLC